MGLRTVTAAIALFTLLQSCTKDKIEGITDAELLELATQTSGFTWYALSDSLLERSSGSGHAQPFLRTRYNSVAASQLDENGKVIEGASFPEGSLIVKELYNDSTTIGRYAILYKKADMGVADARGWIWGYVNADGSVAAAASKKGASCINCHSQSENRDYMLMNKYFP